jgi:hypothetical protein
MPDANATRPVRLGEVLPVLVIAPAVAWAFVWFDAPVRFSASALVGIAAGGAAVIGLPVWFWAADHGRTSLLDRLWLGGVAGLGPSILVLLAAALGLLVRGGGANVRWAFAHGAPIPAYGVLPWDVFAGFAVECACVGAASGAVQWALARLRGHR